MPTKLLTFDHSRKNKIISLFWDVRSAFDCDEILWREKKVNEIRLTVAFVIITTNSSTLTAFGSMLDCLFAT